MATSPSNHASRHESRLRKHRRSRSYGSGLPMQNRHKLIESTTSRLNKIDAILQRLDASVSKKVETQTKKLNDFETIHKSLAQIQDKLVKVDADDPYLIIGNLSAGRHVQSHTVATTVLNKGWQPSNDDDDEKKIDDSIDNNNPSTPTDVSGSATAVLTKHEQDSSSFTKLESFRTLVRQVDVDIPSDSNDDDPLHKHTPLASSKSDLSSATKSRHNDSMSSLGTINLSPPTRENDLDDSPLFTAPKQSKKDRLSSFFSMDASGFQTAAGVGKKAFGVDVDIECDMDDLFSGLDDHLMALKEEKDGGDTADVDDDDLFAGLDDSLANLDAAEPQPTADSSTAVADADEDDLFAGLDDHLASIDCSTHKKKDKTKKSKKKQLKIHPQAKSGDGTANGRSDSIRRKSLVVNRSQLQKVEKHIESEKESIEQMVERMRSKRGKLDTAKSRLLTTRSRLEDRLLRKAAAKKKALEARKQRLAAGAASAQSALRKSGDLAMLKVKATQSLSPRNNGGLFWNKPVPDDALTPSISYEEALRQYSRSHNSLDNALKSTDDDEDGVRMRAQSHHHKSNSIMSTSTTASEIAFLGEMQLELDAIERMMTVTMTSSGGESELGELASLATAPPHLTTTQSASNIKKGNSFLALESELSKLQSLSESFEVNPKKPKNTKSNSVETTAKH